MGKRACIVISVLWASIAQADRLPPTTTVCVPGAEAPDAGIVLALSGDVIVESEQCDVGVRHALACGEVLREGDLLVTGASGAVAFDMNGTRVQVAPDSELRVERRASGSPDLTLHRGRVRVVDPENGGDPARRIATPDLVSVGRGDTEARVLAAQPATICSYEGPLMLTPIGGGASHELAPGNCSAADFAALGAAGIGVSLLDAARCDVADRFEPTDVASAPPPAPFPPPLVPAPPPPVCAAGTCGNTPPPRTPPLGIVESPGINEPPPP